jgi:AraC-like DNA-binding protein
VSDLVTALFAHTLDEDASLPPETAGRTLTLRIKAFIHQHLHDRELTPTTIAVTHHISRSYLYRLFQAEGTTVVTYIWRKRLEAARRDLADPALRATPRPRHRGPLGIPPRSRLLPRVPRRLRPPTR